MTHPLFNYVHMQEVAPCSQPLNYQPHTAGTLQHLALACCKDSAKPCTLFAYFWHAIPTFFKIRSPTKACYTLYKPTTIPQSIHIVYLIPSNYNTQQIVH